MGRPYARGTALLTLLTLGTVTLPVAAQQKETDSLVGTWVGALALPSGTSLRVVFHVTAAGDGTLSGTMDSPDQGASGIPLSDVSHVVADIHFGVSAIRAAFEGHLSTDHSSIVGTWSQGGLSLPLTLKRTPATRSSARSEGSPSLPAAVPRRPRQLATHVDSGRAQSGQLPEPHRRPPSPTAHPQVTGSSGFQWRPIVDMGGELFPAFVLATASMKTNVLASGPRMIQSGNYFGDALGLFGVQVTAPHAGTHVRVQITVPGFAAASEQDAVLAAQGQTYDLFPLMLYDYSALRKVREPTPVNVLYRLFVDDSLVGKKSKVIQVRSVNDAPFEWVTRQGQRLNLSWIFAAFVDENAPQVDSLLSAALRSTHEIKMFDGYQAHSTADVQRQVYAIWHVLQLKGFQYSNITTPSAFSATVASQHVRFLGDALRVSEANCVDGSVLFASVLYKIGIDPFLVMIPGHMMVGFYLDPQHKQKSVLETTMMGEENLRKTSLTGALNNLFGESGRLYNAAINEGAKEFNENRQKFGHVPGYLIIDIAAARKMGIMPIE